MEKCEKCRVGPRRKSVESWKVYLSGFFEFSMKGLYSKALPNNGESSELTKKYLS